jgi:methyltransferase family protein
VAAAKNALKSRLPGLIRLAGRLGRFRFMLKARRVRESGVRFRERPLQVARFVLFDPETHSYSFELANKDELVRFAARVTRRPEAEMERYLAETEDDPELNERLRRRVRWRLDYKRSMPLGNRLLWYLLVRALRPELTVETGIYQGLGSLAVLRALERNAEEGDEGRLMSIDIDPESGWLVAPHLRERWEPVFQDVETALDDNLRGREVGLFIHESDHNETLQRIEFGAALRHAARDVYVVDSGGFTQPVLAELSKDRASRLGYFVPEPENHFYRPDGTSVAVFRRPAAERRRTHRPVEICHASVRAG